MGRVIKRYESRKLYDTQESRYVSLEEIGEWVRAGQHVRVIDNATEADVTAPTLTQIILDEGKKGVALSSELLHELVRRGERAVASGVEQVKQGVDRFVRTSIDRLAPVQRARAEMSELRRRLKALEDSLAAIEPDQPKPTRTRRRPRR
jgi:polyhydroxyalkanoate synthesis repressor PhaR